MPRRPSRLAFGPRLHPHRVVALGGGHGLAATLSALRHLRTEITAVVTVADNGGSSGRLRRELGVLPPGDLRQALAALCGDDEWGETWARILQHRFGGDGELQGHAAGNLLMVAIWDLLGDHVEGLDLVGDLLGARGRVLPMSAVPLDITADVVLPGDTEPTRVRGQAEVATAQGDVRGVALDPHDPPACPEAVDAVLGADWVTVGPGSWFTSVLPNLLVPQLFDALHDTPARRAVVLNLEEQEGETTGFSAARHLDVLAEHAPDLRIDVVLADHRVVDDRASLDAAARGLGAEVQVATMALRDGTARHDPLRLAAAFEQMMKQA